MIAPAAMPPITPAPTAQPTHRAFAAVGAARVARASAPAAAKAVRVFLIGVPLCGGCDRPSTERGFAAPSILRATGIEADRSPANLSEICYRCSPGVQNHRKSPGKDLLLRRTNAERRAVPRPALQPDR